MQTLRARGQFAISEARLDRTLKESFAGHGSGRGTQAAEKLMEGVKSGIKPALRG